MEYRQAAVYLNQVSTCEVLSCGVETRNCPEGQLNIWPNIKIQSATGNTPTVPLYEFARDYGFCFLFCFVTST